MTTANQPGGPNTAAAVGRARALGLGFVSALGFAVLTALAHPGASLWPFALVALVPLVLVASSHAARERPWMVALGVLLGSVPLYLYLLAYIEAMTALGYVPLCFYMALYVALAVRLMAIVARRWPEGPKWALTRPCALGAVWVGVEVLRGDLVLGGFPWFYAGHPLIDAPMAPELATVLGAPGVSLAVAIVNALLASALLVRGTLTARVVPVAAAIAVLGLACVPGALRSVRGGEVPPALRVASIQTNVPMNNKVGWTPRQMLEDWRRFITLTRHAATPPEGPAPDLIVWPETMHPTSGLDAESDATQRKLGLVLPYVDEAGRRRELASTFFTDALLALQQEADIPMLVGAIAYEGFTLKERPDGGIAPDYRHRYNSMFMVRGGRVEAERYDKLRLTPFGEEMPGVRHIPGLAKALQDFAARGLRTDLSAGTRATVFRVKARESGREFRIVTPICYETTVSDVCRRLVYGPEGRRADIIVNPSNDGWFAWSDAGRETHLNLARWRAVELGTPIIRAVNTGISALIDSRGRVTARAIDPGPLTPDPDASGPEVMADFAAALERGARVDGVLAADVPMATRSTLFGTALGPAVPWGMLSLAAGALALAAWKGRGTGPGTGRPTEGARA